MAFDITTAKPIQGARFDISTAKPVEEPKRETASTVSRFGSGLADPAYGIAQLVPRGIEAVTSLGGLAPNSVSDFYGQDAKRMDEVAKSREAEYQKKAPEGFDWARLAGNIASPTNIVAGGMAARGATAGLGAKTLAGMAGGAATAGTMPVTSGEDFATEKMKQIGYGALGGGAAPIVGSAVGRMLNPATDDAVKGMLKEGIKLTPGEMAGGIVKRGEDLLSSVPLVGSLVKNAQRKSIESLNTAAINRALKPIGKSLPKNVNLGRDAIGYAEAELGKAYDDLLPKLTGKVDDEFIDDIAGIKDLVAVNDIMYAPEKAKFLDILGNIEKRISPNKGILGNAIKELESEIGDKASKFSRGTIQEQDLAGALLEVQDSLRSMVARSNPQYSKELASINKGWANFKRVQRAAAMVGSDQGVFTPSQLQNAVKALDRSKDKSAFAQGSALMQDLSDPAKSAMAQSIPNSGTADRALAAGTMFSLGGGAALSPMAIPTAIAGAAYMPGGRRIAQALLTERPDAARSLGKAAAKYSQYLAAPIAAPLGKKQGD